MKGASSWLVSQLATHPDIFIPGPELHFFNDAENRAKGLAWYETHFEGADGFTAVGEKTAGYMLPGDHLNDIHEVLGNPKLIAVVRNPVDRMQSQINHHLRYRAMAVTPGESVLGTPEFDKANERFSLVERGMYASQFRGIDAIFGDHATHVLTNETDVAADPKATLRGVCRVLGVDESHDFDKRDELIHSNKVSGFAQRLESVPLIGAQIRRLDRFLPSSKKKSVFTFTPADRAELLDLYAQPNRDLFQYLDRDLPESWST